MRAPYPVNITQLDDGTFVLQVGCKQLSFTSLPVTELARYFEHPETVIREYSRRLGWNLNEPVAPAVGGAALGYAANVASPRY